MQLSELIAMLTVAKDTCGDGPVWLGLNKPPKKPGNYCLHSAIQTNVIITPTGKTSGFYLGLLSDKPEP